MVQFLIFVSTFCFSQNPTNLNVIHWHTQSDGSVYLIPHQEVSIFQNPIFPIDGRLPASVSSLNTVTRPLPYSHSSPGLGRYSCLKKGFQNSGLREASSKFIAAIAIKAKERHDASIMPQNKKDEASLKEAIQTLSAIGVCNAKEYAFKSSDIYWAESWINSPHSAVDESAFKKIFGIETSRLEQVIENNGSFDKIKRNWDFWAKNTPSHNCAKTFASKSTQICKTLARTCDVSADMCEETLIKKSVSHSKLKFNSEPQIALAPSTLQPNENPLENKSPAINHDNTKAGHGPDSRGHHGYGPY